MAPGFLLILLLPTRRPFFLRGVLERGGDSAAFSRQVTLDPPPFVVEDSALPAPCSPPESEMQSDPNCDGVASRGSSRQRLYTLGGVQTQHGDSYDSTQLASSALCFVVKGTVLTSRVPRSSGNSSTFWPKFVGGFATTQVLSLNKLAFSWVFLAV